MLHPRSDHRAKFAAEIKQNIQELARRLHYREKSSGVYVVGNTLDFDYVAQPIIDLVGTDLAGAATFWPKPAGVSALTGNHMFALTQEFIGNCDREKPDLLFCQACIGSSRETIAPPRPRHPHSRHSHRRRRTKRARDLFCRRQSCASQSHIAKSV